MKTNLWNPVLLVVVGFTTLTGCGMTESASPSSGMRSLDDATADTKKISSEILDVIDVKGKVSKPGPGVSRGCNGDSSSEKFYRMRHPWSLSDVPRTDLQAAMERLKEELPQRGWKIVEYGPNSSRNKSLELTADNDKKKFGVNVVFVEKSDNPRLSITVISGCYEIPAGQKIDRY